MRILKERLINLLEIFATQQNISWRIALIGGEAIIMHGIPRVTIDTDFLLNFSDKERKTINLTRNFASFLKQHLGERMGVKHYEAAKDSSDPLKHDLIVIKDAENEFSKLDILFANYEWELEGLNQTELFKPLPKPFLIGMKLMAGGPQDDQDIRNLYLIMDENEKEKAASIAKLIRRDKNLLRIIDGI